MSADNGFYIEVIDGREVRRPRQDVFGGPQHEPPRVATLSAVCLALLNAGFTEHAEGAGPRPDRESFEIAAGEVGGRFEVCVGDRSGPAEWASLEAMWAARRAHLDEYAWHIRAAGFGAVTEDGRVIVTPAKEER